MWWITLTGWVFTGAERAGPAQVDGVERGPLARKRNSKTVKSEDITDLLHRRMENERSNS